MLATTSERTDGLPGPVIEEVREANDLQTKVADGSFGVPVVAQQPTVSTRDIDAPQGTCDGVEAGRQNEYVQVECSLLGDNAGGGDGLDATFSEVDESFTFGRLNVS